MLNIYVFTNGVAKMCKAKNNIIKKKTGETHT